MNAYGGENRFWLGHEGGVFSMFFAKGTEQKFDNWHTPPAYDSEAWTLVRHDDTSASFRKEMSLANYAGTKFSLTVDRMVKLVQSEAYELLLGISVPKAVKAVAYRTENTVTNTGHFAWDKNTGMPCTWLLDMFPPSDQTTIVIPVKTSIGSPATTDYFGEIQRPAYGKPIRYCFLKRTGSNALSLGTSWPCKKCSGQLRCCTSCTDDHFI